MDGARWVQETVLDANADMDLRVYAIWFRMYAGDQRDRWPADALTDPRVLHYWDEEKVVGTWYAQHLSGIVDRMAPGSRGYEAPVLWDAYLVYGPESQWHDGPDGLRRWGRTILGTGEGLREAVGALSKAAVPR